MPVKAIYVEMLEEQNYPCAKARLEDKLTAAETQAERDKTKIAELETQLAECQNADHTCPPDPRVAELEKELDAAKSELTKTKEDLVNANDLVERYRNESLSKDAEIRSKNEQLAQKETTITDLTRQLDECKRPKFASYEEFLEAMKARTSTSYKNGGYNINKPQSELKGPQIYAVSFPQDGSSDMIGGSIRFTVKAPFYKDAVTHQVLAGIAI